MIKKAIAASALLAATAVPFFTTATPAAAETIDETMTKLDIAIVDKAGHLTRPNNLDKWIFMGQTIGMTYIEGQPDPEDLGYTSTVLMEPTAYEIFLETGEFPEGTLMAKVVRETMVEGGGLFMGEEVALEIHLKDKERFPKHGFNFWFMSAGEDRAHPMPADNSCVSCHTKTAQYDKFFTQYYPTIRHKVPKD